MRIIMRLADAVLLRKGAAAQQSNELKGRQVRTAHPHTEL